MIIVGVVVVSLNHKQHKAVEELVDNTYAKHARHLANSYAKAAVNEIIAMKADETGDILEDTVLYDLANVQNIANSEVRVTVSRDTLKGEDIELDDYAITSVSEVLAPDGTRFIARTNILFKHGSEYTPPVIRPPPIEIETGINLPSGQNLVFRLLPNGAYIDVLDNNSDHNSFHNGVNPTIPNVTMTQLEDAGFSIRIRGPINGLGVRIALNNTNASIPINYSLYLYVEGNVTIEGHLVTTPAHKIRIFAEGNIYWGNRHNSGSVPNPYIIDADLFARGNILQAAGLMNGTTAPWNTIRIRANYTNAYINVLGYPTGTLSNGSYNLTGQGNLYSNLSQAALNTLWDLYASDDEDDPDDPGTTDPGGDDDIIDEPGFMEYIIGIRSVEQHPIQIIRPGR
jgi:hypothetical protein